MCNLANHTIWCDCHTRPSLKEQLAQAHREGWEQGKQQASGICKADIQEHAITISAAQQETHNNCCNYLAKAIDAMEYNHGN